MPTAFAYAVRNARILAAGLAGLGLAACASSPAPAPIQHRVHASAATQPQARMVSPYEDVLAWTAAHLPAQPVIDDSGVPLQCVPFARDVSGVRIWGDAVTWWDQADGLYARSSRPAPGSVLALRGWNDDKRGHVAVVTQMLADRVLLVDHANWLKRGEITLNVPVIDVSPANDWSEVRVWHIPGGHWGGRTYGAFGFIHPIGGALASR